MKKYNSILLLAACFILAGIFTGCKKDNGGGGPVISSIRAIAPAPNDSTLTRAAPGQTIVIRGANLASATQIYFNGYQSAFNSALFADNNIVVTIPADMPFASLDQSQLNTIRVVTPEGEVTYSFPIEPPAPVVQSMTNEMAVAGERVTLFGNNFFFIDKVVFPGGIEVATDISTNASGTTLDVTVPAGITTGGPLEVVNRYGTGVSLLRFNDMVTGMLCNFDNVNTLNNWAGVGISSDASLFPGNRGTFARMTVSGIAAGDWAWYGGGRSINVEIPGTWVPVASLGESTDNWAVKFEINTRVPWKNGSLLVTKDYSWSYMHRLQPWQQSGEYTSNGWKTIVMPLSQFKTADGTGNPPPNIEAVVGSSGTGGINIFHINAGTTVIENFDLGIDNLRVAKMK